MSRASDSEVFGGLADISKLDCSPLVRRRMEGRIDGIMFATTTTAWVWIRQVRTSRCISICIPRAFSPVTAARGIASSMPRQTNINASQKNNDDGGGGGEGGEKQTSQGHPLMQPPNTGWKGPIPAREGGREEQYLQKVSCSSRSLACLLACSLLRILTLVVFFYWSVLL